MVVSAWLTALGHESNGKVVRVHTSSIHLSSLHGVLGGKWWWVGAGSLSGHAEVTYTVNSHVGGRNLTYLTHKKHDHHLGI